MTAFDRDEARRAEADLKRLGVVASAHDDGSGCVTMHHSQVRKLIGEGIAQLYRSSVEILVRREDGKYLTVTNRRWGGFSCPGGKIEPGEHPEDAMMRELKEETGLDVCGFRQVWGGVHLAMPKDPGPPWMCLAYEAIVPDGQEPSAVEANTKIGWSTSDELAEHSLYPDYYRGLWTALSAPRGGAGSTHQKEVDGLS